MQHPGTIDEVRWQQVFPWLLLIPAARSALFIRVIAITALGALATTGGWTVLGRVVGVDSAAWPVAIEAPTSRESLTAETTPPWFSATGPRGRFVQQNPLLHAWEAVAGPWLGVLAAETTRQRTYLALCGIWSLAVWGWAGGATAWITAVWVTRRENATAGAALGRATLSSLSAIGGPAVTLLTAIILCIPLAAAGWLMRHAWLGVAVSLGWGAALFVGLLIAGLLLGLAVGWPLMIVTAAVDRSDLFDGVSRALAYVYQRPLHLLWYLLVAGVLAAVVQLGVVVAVEATIAVAEEVVGYGAGAGRAVELFDASATSSDWAAWLISSWRDALRAAVRWFPLALFWSLATGIYLLLRFQVDQTELDELTESTPNG